MQPLPEVPGVTHRDVMVGTTRWHVAEAGDGPPLVLVHGWPQHWYAWRKVIPDLAKDHRVIAPDLPGFGWSDAPPGTYSKQELADGLLGLLDALEIQRTSLVAHDWGGFAGFLACLDAPERFERYVCMNIIHPWIDVPPPTPGTAARASYQFLLATPVFGERLLRHVPKFVEFVIQRGSGPDATWTSEELRAFSHQYDDLAHARAASHVYRTFLTKELPALRKRAYDDRHLTVPTLLLTGDHDPVVTPERVAGHEGHADDLRFEVVPDCGHFTAEEQPEAALRLIRGFLA
ncbi:MAG: alpha/beta hydrolase [Solirubrobacterales bacterium]|nr:alpha/beta hydrolase [Solirubrobacterales bacterium]